MKPTRFAPDMTEAILFDTTGRSEAELELRLGRRERSLAGWSARMGSRSRRSVGLRTSGSIFSGSACGRGAPRTAGSPTTASPWVEPAVFPPVLPVIRTRSAEDVIALDASIRGDRLHAPARPDQALSGEAGRQSRGPATRVRHDRGARRQGRGLGRGTLGPARQQRQCPRDQNRRRGRISSGGCARLRRCPVGDGQGSRAELPARGSRRRSTNDGPSDAWLDDPGRVVDDAGQPIEGVRVVPKVKNPRPRWAGSVYLDELQGTTDRDGRYNLEGMPEDVTCDVVAEGWRRSEGRRSRLRTSRRTS